MAVDSTSGAVELLKKKPASDPPGGYGYLLVFVDPSSKKLYSCLRDAFLSRYLVRVSIWYVSVFFTSDPSLGRARASFYKEAQFRKKEKFRKNKLKEQQRYRERKRQN